MSQDRLFFVHPRSISLTAVWSYPEGWRVTIGSWTGVERDGDDGIERFDHLTGPELLDVIEADVSRRLGLL